MATATRTVTYTDEETALTGFLAWDDAAAASASRTAAGTRRGRP